MCTLLYNSILFVVLSLSKYWPPSFFFLFLVRTVHALLEYLLFQPQDAGMVLQSVDGFLSANRITFVLFLQFEKIKALEISDLSQIAKAVASRDIGRIVVVMNLHRPLSELVFLRHVDFNFSFHYKEGR